MYVCMCNCVTDRQLVEAATEFAPERGGEGVTSFAERVADRLGAGLGCGSCRTFAIDLLERAAAQQNPVVLASQGRDSDRFGSSPASHDDLPFPNSTTANGGFIASRRP